MQSIPLHKKEVHNLTGHIPFGSGGDKNGVFVALFVRESQPMLGYKDVDEKSQAMTCPRVIMLLRWDSKTGFPGGFVDEGEAFTVAATREVKEETGLSIDEDKLKPVVSHKVNDWLNVHFYSYEITEAQMREVLTQAPKARDFMAECQAVLAVTLYNPTEDKGFSTWIDNVDLAPAVHDEMACLLETENLTIVNGYPDPITQATAHGHEVKISFYDHTDDIALIDSVALPKLTDGKIEVEYFRNNGRFASMIKNDVESYQHSPDRFKGLLFGGSSYKQKVALFFVVLNNDSSVEYIDRETQMDILADRIDAFNKGDVRDIVRVLVEDQSV